MLNFVQLLFLLFAFALAAAFGVHFYQSWGWWSMFPAIALGALLIFVIGAGFRTTFLAWKGRHKRNGHPHEIDSN